MTKTRTPEPLSSDGRCMQPIVPREMMLNASRDNPRMVGGGGRQPKTTTRKVLSPGEIRQRTLEREEMQSLLAKLKQLVPGIPKNRRLTKLEIIQHVIDYIFDLQVALESHPNMPAAAANVEFLSELNDLYSMEQLQMSSTTESAVVSADQCDPIYHHNHHQSHQPHYHQQHPQSHSHLHPQQPQGQQQQPHQQSPQQARIPGSYRQPLASIML